MILHRGVIRAILLCTWTRFPSGTLSGPDRTRGPAHTWTQTLRCERFYRSQRLLVTIYPLQMWWNPLCWPLTFPSFKRVLRNALIYWLSLSCSSLLLTGKRLWWSPPNQLSQKKIALTCWVSRSSARHSTAAALLRVTKTLPCIFTSWLLSVSTQDRLLKLVWL